jgi:hypothetical protein
MTETPTAIVCRRGPLIREALGDLMPGYPYGGGDISTQHIYRHSRAGDAHIAWKTADDQGKAWIVCRLRVKGRRHEMMAGAAGRIFLPRRGDRVRRSLLGATRPNPHPRHRHRLFAGVYAVAALICSN